MFCIDNKVQELLAQIDVRRQEEDRNRTAKRSFSRKQLTFAMNGGHVSAAVSISIAFVVFYNQRIEPTGQFGQSQLIVGMEIASSPFVDRTVLVPLSHDEKLRFPIDDKVIECHNIDF